MKKINVSIIDDYKLNKDYPISFICGQEMIELSSKKEPSYGITCYLLHKSEFNDGKWMRNCRDRKRISIYVFPDSMKYSDLIKNILDNNQSFIRKSFDFGFINMIEGS